MNREYKKPILASIYDAFGWLIVGVGVIAAITSILGGRMYGGPTGVAGFIAALLVAAIIALPFFGIAQIFQFIGKTAFYTEAISDHLKTAMYDLNNSIKQIASVASKGNNSEPREQTVNCPHCGSDIPLRTIKRGVNNCPDCRQTFEAG